MYLYHTSTPLLSSSTSKKNPLLSSYFHVFSPSPSLHVPLHLLRIVSLYEHWWEGIDLSKGNLSVATALKNVTPLPQQPLTAYSSSREGVAYPTHDGILRGPHLCWSRAGSTAAMIHGYNTLIFRRQFSRDLLPILWEWLWYAFCPPFLQYSVSPVVGGKGMIDVTFRSEHSTCSQHTNQLRVFAKNHCLLQTDASLTKAESSSYPWV